MINGDLPKGWVWAKLNEIGKVFSGGTPSTKDTTNFDGDIPWITPADLSGSCEKYISKGKRNITQKGLDSSSAVLLPIGTILFSSRAPIGYAAIALNPVSTNQGFKNLVVNKGVFNEYVFHYLKANKELVESFASGTTFLEISGTRFGQLPIPIPPISEQRHIVKVLDQADELRQKRKQTIELLDDYLKSVFLEMFGDPATNPKGWDKIPLKQVVEIQSGQVDPRVEPYASMIHIGGADIESNTGKIFNKIPAREMGLISGKYLFDQSYLLYSKIRPYLNKVVLPDFKGICSADIYPIKPKAELNKYFLAFVLKSDGFLEYAIRNSGRANIPKINRPDLLKYEIIVPDIGIQNRFESIFRETDALKQKMLAQSEQLETQFQALLQESFKGELNGSGNDMSMDGNGCNLVPAKA